MAPFILCLALVAAPPPRPASVSAQVGRSGAGNSWLPLFSGDGRFIVFVSQANNLVTNDDLGLSLDVFVRELETGRTTLVSVNRTGQGGASADANYGAVSADGRFIAFASAASNLVLNDTNSASDVFVRDLITGTTTLVSVDTNGTAPPSSNLGSTSPLISADGRWVFFESAATTLVNAPDGANTQDIFARDLASNLTVLVSVRLSGEAGVNASDQAELCSITPDGRWTAFVSGAANFATGVANRAGDVYVRDMRAGLTTWASTNVPSFFPAGGYRCVNAALSEDARFVAFKAIRSPSTDPAEPVLLFRHELASGLTALISSNAPDIAWPGVGANGRFVAWSDTTNVFVWDGQAGSNILVSAGLGGEAGNGLSQRSGITPDGRFVSFVSTATNLVTNVVNGRFQLYVRDVVAGRTRLVTVNAQGTGSSSDHEVIAVAMSADGGRVAFESEDDNLVQDDFNQASDVLVRDFSSNTTELVSERAATLPALTGVQHCRVPVGNCVSADGRFLAFSSLDNTLVPGDTNGWEDVFVRDLFTGSNRMVGIWTNRVLNPMLSANGRFVLFTKPGSDLGAPTVGDVFRFDLVGNTTELVNQRFDGAGPANQPAFACGLSGDGQSVLFQSKASDLVSSATPGGTNVFLRNMVVRSNVLVSATPGGGSGNGSSYGATMSPDTRWVVFMSTSTDLQTNTQSGTSPWLYLRDTVSQSTFFLAASPRPPFVFSSNSLHLAFASASGGLPGSLTVCELATQSNTLVSPPGFNPSLSGDGRFMAYNTLDNAASPLPQIMIWDRQTGLSALASMNTNGAPAGSSRRGSVAPLLTPDGRYVVFASRAPDLAPNDAGDMTDLYVRDLAASNTMAISVSSQTGATGNRATGPSVLSRPLTERLYQLGADGRTVVFQSLASDLVPGDFNDKRDVFVLRLGAADSDHDGMDDDWEMAFFGTLDRDGTADFDQDGVSDLAEFRAGTDPTNKGSILRASTLRVPNWGGTTLLWPAVPGQNYRVQYKDDLGATAWQDLDSPVVVNGSTGSAVDTAAAGAGQRFYRVLIVP